MSAVNIIFPHQLFQKSPVLKNGLKCILIEEHLYFTQYNFHKQKIAFHRASMQSYLNYLRGEKIDVDYIDAQNPLSDLRLLLKDLKQNGVEELHYIETSDYYLEQRIHNSGLPSKKYDSPLFLNTASELSHFFKTGQKKFFQTKFYIEQRQKWNILLENHGGPIGGKWSFDHENRKKYPKGKVPPKIASPGRLDYYSEAVNYTLNHFGNNPGKLGEEPIYPINFQQSQEWLQTFLQERFEEFGTYEDAIVANENFLNHSILTPMLNVGLLIPKQIIHSTMEYMESNDIPINSAEGFIRQIIGWREFIRGLYEYRGVQQRTTNFWGFYRKIPSSFYDGSTGIVPLDNTIKKVLETGYCHHIERLMILGNFMVLCEFDPDEVYRWFMELFIDAYDWVMVPNVYGMSQFADGGIMATKPYISGSNYLNKMSDYSKGEWQQIWDGLFWRFMHVNREFFLKNPRLSMLVRMFDKMPEEKQQEHLKNANQFISSLNI